MESTRSKNRKFFKKLKHINGTSIAITGRNKNAAHNPESTDEDNRATVNLLMEMRNDFMQVHTKSLDVKDINIVKLYYDIDLCMPKISENSDSVRITTPAFGTHALVEIPPLEEGISIQLGWIQVCTGVTNICRYGEEGIASWEFPEITNGTYSMISDSDGDQMPWYGVDHFCYLKGPIQQTSIENLTLIDQLSTKSGWEIPVSGYTDVPSLTYIYRKQNFYTFLVLFDAKTKQWQILRKLTWGMEVAIDVDPNKPIGERCHFLGPCEQIQPKMMDINTPPYLTMNALQNPVANKCQAFLWRPKNAYPEISSTPIESTVDMANYLISTREHTYDLFKYNKKQFFLEQKELLMKKKNAHALAVKNGMLLN